MLLWLLFYALQVGKKDKIREISIQRWIHIRFYLEIKINTTNESSSEFKREIVFRENRLFKVSIYEESNRLSNKSKKEKHLKRG